MIKSFLFTSMVLLPLLSFARDITLLEVNSESEPEQTSSIGIRVNDQTHRIEALLFQKNVSKDKMKVITVEELTNKNYPLVTFMRIETIGLSATQVSSTSITANLRYLYEFKVGNSIYKEKKLDVYYDFSRNQFVMRDGDSKKVISKAYIYSHYVNGKERGAEKIDTE